MNKDDFIKTLKSDNVSKELKLNCCQFFIDNFPVFINQVIETPMGKIDTGVGFWTALPDYKVKDDPIAMDKLDKNFQKLVKRLNELETFK